MELTEGVTVKKGEVGFQWTQNWKSALQIYQESTSSMYGKIQANVCIYWQF